MRELYKYFVDEKNRRVIAVSTYAGKRVKGIAKANPEDTFDVEKGKQLAAARCNEKVARKRLKRATKKFSIACQNFSDSLAEYNKMKKYALDARTAFVDAIEKTKNILNTF